MDELSNALISVAATWFSAIGIGLIAVGLKLNNNVQRLTAVVERLTEDVSKHDQHLSKLDTSIVSANERLSVLENKSCAKS